MRKRRMEQELNHPRFVGVRLSDIELELLDRKAEILGVSRSECLRKLLVEKEIVRSPIWKNCEVWWGHMERSV